jgi:sarcosine oxidase
MSPSPRVAVIGAGVVGLATATALLEAGAAVRLYDRNEPGREQSKGRTRVFRLAHGEARLVDLAARAERLWRTWESRFRRRLVSDEGLVITGDETVALWTEAMSDAAVPHQLLSIEEASARVPVARPVGSVALFDPAGGPTRARRTVDCLQAVCADSLRREEVLSVEQNADVCMVSTQAGSWECDEIIMTAGVETGTLAAAAGIGRDAPVIHDSRFTYSVTDAYCGLRLACWFDHSEAYGPGLTSYGQRVGSTDFYAVGVGWGDTTGLTPDEESELHRAKAQDYMRQAYPGLNPVPVDEIRCSHAGFGLREDGDGFLARRSGGITALYGNNLFKFAPLLGQLLCQTAMSGELPAELAVPEPAVQ